MNVLLWIIFIIIFICIIILFILVGICLAKKPCCELTENGVIFKDNVNVEKRLTTNEIKFNKLVT
jgi:hypothetical protein